MAIGLVHLFEARLSGGADIYSENGWLECTDIFSDIDRCIDCQLIYRYIIIYTYLISVLNLLLMNVQIVHEGMTIYDDYLLLIIYEYIICTDC